jgi:peptidoglycan/xylan/chitin deacetylase (PgdA/CDA1 family)
MSSKFYHGIMFHHFHDNKKHNKSEGSISKDDFYKIIKFIGKKNILNASEFFLRLKENRLKSNHVCITFDDALKSQFDIAMPVLQDLNIKCYYFVYSSLFTNEPDLLEVYRFFRNNFYKNNNEFYKEFYKLLNTKLDSFFSLKKKIIKEKKNQFPFYSFEDIKFRLVKNYLLSNDKYKKIMNKLFEIKKFKPSKYFNKLFVNKKDLIKIDSMGHTIGLHSHTHPTFIEGLSNKKQRIEYEKNRTILAKILNKNKNSFFSMSHPCGSYSNSTLQILKDLRVNLGFKQMMKVDKNRGMSRINNSHLEIAREDHTTILKKIIK